MSCRTAREWRARFPPRRWRRLPCRHCPRSRVTSWLALLLQASTRGNPRGQTGDTNAQAAPCSDGSPAGDQGGKHEPSVRIAGRARWRAQEPSGILWR